MPRGGFSRGILVLLRSGLVLLGLLVSALAITVLRLLPVLRLLLRLLPIYGLLVVLVSCSQGSEDSKRELHCSG